MRMHLQQCVCSLRTQGAHRAECCHRLSARVVFALPLASPLTLFAPVMDEDGTSSSSWASDVEHIDQLEELEESSTCLFCSESLPTFESTFNHIKAAHQLDLIRECHSRNCDCIDYIKMINFIRKEKPQPASVFALMDTWRQGDTYMKPTFSDDHLLQFGIL